MLPILWHIDLNLRYTHFWQNCYRFNSIFFQSIFTFLKFHNKISHFSTRHCYQNWEKSYRVVTEFSHETLLDSLHQPHPKVQMPVSHLFVTSPGIWRSQDALPRIAFLQFNLPLPSRILYMWLNNSGRIVYQITFSFVLRALQ